MKTLLLHIGYPKTATTTLQEEVFLSLHKKGKINYLGRTITSTHTKSGISTFDGNDVVVNIRRHFVLNEKLLLSKDFLVEDKLNVISDEDLTFHGFFHKAQFGVDVNPFEYPAKLKEILGKDVEVQLLVTLRNQPDLIFSCFAQKYRFVRKNLGELSFKDFLSNKDTSFFDLYEFDKVLDNFQNTFNSKISILFFEDFIKKPDLFWEKLSDVLPATQSELKEHAGIKHYRKKDKTNEFLKIQYNQLSILGKCVAILFGGEKMLMLKIDKRHHMSYSVLKKLEKMFLLKSIPEKLILPDDEDKIRLRKLFRDSNLRLAANYQIDLNKLKMYSYID